MSAKRLVIPVSGAILMMFGAACINCTKPSALEHHRSWAAQHDAPPPSDTVLMDGVVSHGGRIAGPRRLTGTTQSMIPR